jgi:hypothetical protein
VTPVRGRSGDDRPPVTDEQISAALNAELLYLDECERRRRACSQEVFGHTGASIPSAAPNQRERMRRVLDAGTNLNPSD